MAFTADTITITINGTPQALDHVQALAYILAEIEQAKDKVGVTDANGEYQAVLYDDALSNPTAFNTQAQRQSYSVVNNPTINLATNIQTAQLQLPVAVIPGIDGVGTIASRLKFGYESA
jgi:hypothetical protein